MSKKDLIKKIIPILKKKYPDAKIALNFGNEFELLVAVILSAQCTDVRVNKITPLLFKKYSHVADYAEADLEELEKYIYSTGFYKNKAKNIKGAAKMVEEKFHGRLPQTMKELLLLPGVARKTANVILNSAFGKNEGVVVDTHVIRLSGLIGLVDAGLSKAKNAVKIEQELIKIVPRDEWGIFAHLLIHHGRNICIARRPKCEVCPIKLLCNYGKKSLYRMR